MKKPVMPAITPENFDSCWQFIDPLRRKSRRMCAIARIGGFFSNLVLMLALVVAVNVLIWLNFQGSYPNFLSAIPGFLKLMELFSAHILKPGDSAQIQALKLMAAAYALAVLVFILQSLLIRLIYHPLKKPVPKGDYAEKTAALAAAARDAQDHAYRTHLSPSMASIMIIIFSIVILFLAYIIYINDYDKSVALLTIFPTQDPYVNCALYALALYIPCGVSSWLLLVLSRWIYRYDFPHDLAAQAEAAVLFAREEFDGLTPEEISSRRRERAAAIRDEALELEKEVAYQKAKKMLYDAALLGDIPAMEHYGRHCLLSHLDDSARYWLDRAIATGEASTEASRMRRWLMLGLHHKAQYLRPDAAPLTKWQKCLRILKTVFSVLIRILVLLMLLGSVAVLVLLLTDKLDITALTDALSRLFS